jgi:hypothetical protein
MITFDKPAEVFIVLKFYDLATNHMLIATSKANYVSVHINIEPSKTRLHIMALTANAHKLTLVADRDSITNSHQLQSMRNPFGTVSPEYFDLFLSVLTTPELSVLDYPTLQAMLTKELET